MDTIPITLHISTSEDNKADSDTNLSIVDVEDEKHPDLSTWIPAERKKIATYDRVSQGISMCVQQTGFPSYYNEM